MAPQLSRAEAEGWPAGDWAAQASQNTLIMSRASCEDLLAGVDQEVHSLTNHHIAHVIGGSLLLVCSEPDTIGRWSRKVPL